MQYQSTRSDQDIVSSACAIVQGIAADGGLFVPKTMPQISMNQINNMAQMDYQGRAFAILKLFLDDFTDDELKNCISSAYGSGSFDTPAIAPVVKLNNTDFVLELWHGPTCAFKDMALQILPHLLTTAMKKLDIKEDIVILVATSGDTGKAALDGFADVAGSKILVFFPQDGVSNIQRAQMVTQDGNNVSVCSVHGNFDDAQTGVKMIFGEDAFTKQLLEQGYRLSSANSINWGRLVPQIVYYFSAYCDMLNSGEITLGQKINFCVPTGNFGNILAGFYASQMGLPVHHFICASNSNNVLTDFIKTGTYDKNRDFYTTFSPSMDILISSNLERLLYLLGGKDTTKVAGYMDELNQKGCYRIDDALKDTLTQQFYGGYCGEQATMDIIRKIWQDNRYLVDTHTAVACDVCAQYQEQTGDTTKTVIVSTANPFKFNGSVLQALGEDIDFDEFTLLDKLSTKTGESIPPSLSDLKTKPVRFTKQCDKQDMKDMVKSMLGII